MKAKEFLQRWTLIQALFFFLGSLSLLLGIIGLFLPILPTTPFGLLAIVFFNKVDPRLKQWCLKLPYIGPPLQDWDRSGVIRPKAKLLSLSLMLIGAISIWIKSPIPLWVKITISCILFFLMIFVGTRPSKENPKE
jgi:uncharacterized membrane protein YbaN (DUF454 family)